MTTIKGIGFENFRVYKDQSNFDLAPITVLTGANSSGKSTVIKALKLFQKYWENPDGQLPLYFEEGNDAKHHQLGNFRMSLSSETGKDELILRYFLPYHFLFENIFVENVYVLDKSNKMENGELKKSSIIQINKDENVLLYETVHNDGKYQYYVNNKVIINDLIPKLKIINEELENYRSKAKKYIKDISGKSSNKKGDIESFGDYSGPAEYIFFPEGTQAHPVINKEFCDYLEVDLERFNMLDEEYGIFYPHIAMSHSWVDISGIQNLNFNDYKIGSKSKFLKLISQVPKEKYDSLEIELWQLLQRNFPEEASKFNENSFLDLIKQTESDIYHDNVMEDYVGDILLKTILTFDELKELLKHEVVDNFDSFYQDLENQILEENSYYEEKEISESFFTKERYKSNWNLNKKLFSKKKIEEKFRNYDNQNNEGLEVLSCISDYVVRIEQSIFGTIDKSRPVLKLLTKIKEVLDEKTYSTIQKFSKNIHFIDSVRANTQRLYTQASQGTSFNDLLNHFMRNYDNAQHKDFFDKWVKEFEIGDDIEFQTVAGVGAQIFIVKNGKKTNIVDMGYGVTQLLPLIMEISSSDYEKTIVIEEPETNLHPKLQSKLADMLIDAKNELKVSFIIETHSEYLIRKLQYLTAKKDISIEDTIIHYVDYSDLLKRENITDPQIRTIRIQEDGSLSEPFGTGFYDEANNLSMKLWNFSKD